MKRLEFYFDYSSPFAYLGSKRIEQVAERAGAELVWKPMLLGAVFKAIGTPNIPLFEASQSKRSYLMRELYRWADLFEVPFDWPRRFPMNTVMALRVTMVLDDPVPFIHKVFAAYWAHGLDLDDPTQLQTLLKEVGAEPGLVFQTREPEVKQLLRDATTEALEQGVFGAPTCITDVDGDRQLFWGQDRLNFVLKALSEGWNATRD